MQSTKKQNDKEDLVGYKFKIQQNYCELDLNIYLMCKEAINNSFGRCLEMI